MHTDPTEPIENPKETPVEKLEDLAEEVFSKKRTAKEYLEHRMDHPEFSSKETSYENLTSLNNDLEPMDSECKFAVVIPAHNEMRNISRTLDEIHSQTFSNNSKLIRRNFEIIIEVNNTTDETIAEIKRWKEAHQSEERFPISVLNVDFEARPCVGHARKLGADMAILRAYKREDFDPSEFFLIGIDADNVEIPPDHLEKIASAFHRTGANFLTGPAVPDTIEVIRANTEHSEVNDLLDAFEDFESELFKHRERLSQEGKKTKHLFGANHAMSALGYIAIGGYPIRRASEDSYAGIAAVRYEGGATFLDSEIKTDSRRFWEDYYGYIMGGAWKPEKFTSDNKAIRQKIEKKQIEKVLKELDLKQSCVVKTDETAESLYVEPGLENWKDAIRKSRSMFAECCRKNGVLEDMIPNNDRFYIVRAVHARNRDKLFIKRASKSFDDGSKDILSTLPDAAKGSLEGYTPFKVDVTGGSKLYIRRVVEASDTSGDDILYVKLDEDGIPDLM